MVKISLWEETCEVFRPVIQVRVQPFPGIVLLYSNPTGAFWEAKREGKENTDEEQRSQRKCKK